MTFDYDKLLNPSAGDSNQDSRDTYTSVFEAVQKEIVQNHMNDLNACLNENNYDKEEILKRHISSCLLKQGVADTGLINVIFNDMTSFGFLNKYFADKDNIEEININSVPDGSREHPGCVIVNYADGRILHLRERFASISQGVNVLKRMLQKSNEPVDELNAMKVTYVGKNIRLALSVDPVCSKEDGAVASIRFTHPKKFTAKETLQNGTISLPMFTGLSAMINNGISIVVCGDTGSGKTTFMQTLLTTIPDNTRLGILQDGTNDFELLRYDEDGNIVNDVFQLFTRPHQVPEYNITLEKLLDFMMRCDPKVVAIGEMVSEEAFIAQEMARTGHAVVTSIHSNSAESAYQDRMFSLAMRKYQLPKSEMLGMIIRGFSVAVFMHKFKDGIRRVKQIVEAVDVQNDMVIFNPLYRYQIKDNLKDETGTVIKVIGEFEKVNDISDGLRRRLIDNGLSAKEAENIFGGEILERFQKVYF